MTHALEGILIGWGEHGWRVPKETGTVTETALFLVKHDIFAHTRSYDNLCRPFDDLSVILFKIHLYVTNRGES